MCFFICTTKSFCFQPIGYWSYLVSRASTTILEAILSSLRTLTIEYILSLIILLIHLFMLLCVIVEIVVTALDDVVVGVRLLAVHSFTDILVGVRIDFSEVFSLFITEFKASVIFLTLLLSWSSLFLLSVVIFVRCYSLFLFLLFLFPLDCALSLVFSICCSFTSALCSMESTTSFCKDVFLRLLV